MALEGRQAWEHTVLDSQRLSLPLRQDRASLAYVDDNCCRYSVGHAKRNQRQQNHNPPQKHFPQKAPQGGRLFS